MFESWDYEYGRRVLRPFSPARPVLLDVGAALPGGVGLDPLGPPRQLYVRGAGAHFEPVMPGLQVAWLQADTAAWWALVSVEIFSANRRSHVTAHLLARKEHILLDSPENRARTGLDRLR